MRILAMTLCCWDLFPERGFEAPGGNALNVAVQCRRSGAEEVAVLGAVGTDARGDKIIRFLQSRGVDVSRLCRREGRTASHEIVISESGDRLFLPGKFDGGVGRRFVLSPEDWEFAQTFDIAAMTLGDRNLPEARRRLKGRTGLAVDFMTARDPDIIAEMLPDIELAFVSGNEKLAKQLKPCSKGRASPIVVTFGPAGSAALFQGETIFQPAMAVEEVADTTGCGDAYQGAFTVEWLRSRDARQALRAGAAAAAAVLARPGAC